MLVYVARRILWIATTLVVLSVLIFAITQILPGSVARVIAGQFADQEAVDAIAAKLGLNDRCRCSTGIGSERCCTAISASPW